MIGRIAGIIVHRGADHVVIDADGVGYLVQASERTLAGLPAVGEATALWTELLVREDSLTLIGFPSLLEKEWHRLLTTVQGVGAKAAMSLLGTLGPQALGRALTLGDWASLRAAPGIGPKTAQRLIVELKDKAPAVMALAASAASDPTLVPVAAPAEAPLATARRRAAPVPAAPPAGPPPEAEALSALANLGYAPTEAASAVAAAAGADPEAATPALIRAALKLLAPKP